MGSRPDKVNGFFQFTLSFRPQQALGFSEPLTEMSTRSRKIMFLGSRAWPVDRADKGLGKSKTPMTSGIEPATFRLVDSAFKIKSSNFLMLK
jgi:hypothetical protein